METQEEQKAKDIIEEARKVAESLVEKSKEDTSRMIVESIKKAFGEGEEEKKILLLNRVPYICQDIRWIRLMVLGLYGLLGSGIIALLVVVLQQHK